MVMVGGGATAGKPGKSINTEDKIDMGARGQDLYGVCMDCE
jgi:hypothetical protein